MKGFRLFAGCVLACMLESFGPAPSVAYTVSGTVWVDANGNKLISKWEKKFAGATVSLINPSTNAVVKTATSSANGNYSLRNVNRGTYRVRLTVPAGYMGAVTTRLVVNANTVRHFGISQPRSPEEKALNRFGDRWSLARNNPSLPKAGGTGCYRKPGPGMGYTFTQEELDFHRRLNAKFYVEGCAIILEYDPPFSNNVDYDTSERLKAHLDSFKSANPSLKFIGYQQLAEWTVGQVGSKHIYDNQRNWFVYKKGSTTQTDDNILTLRNNSLLLDITNPEYQDYITSRLADAFAYYRIDGLVMDAVAPFPRLAEPTLMPADKLAAWQNGWVSILTKLKAAIGPNRYVFASVLREDLSHARRIIPLVDGIMLEDTFSPVRNDISKRVALQRPIINAAAAAGKWILTTENTFVDGSTLSTTTSAREHRLARYYLSAFYIFKTGKMLFYHNPPATTARQYAAEAFFTDWNIKVGLPTRAYSKVRGRPGVYRRSYTNSIIYLNNSSTPYRIVVPPTSPFKLDPDGKVVKSYLLPAKSGYILSRGQAFQ